MLLTKLSIRNASACATLFLMMAQQIHADQNYLQRYAAPLADGEKHLLLKIQSEPVVEVRDQYKTDPFTGDKTYKSSSIICRYKVTLMNLGTEAIAFKEPSVFGLNMLNARGDAVWINVSTFWGAVKTDDFFVSILKPNARTNGEAIGSVSTKFTNQNHASKFVQDNGCRITTETRFNNVGAGGVTFQWQSNDDFGTDGNFIDSYMDLIVVE